MRNNGAWFWDSRIRNRGNKLSLCWVLRCLALPWLAALWCVPAAAQYKAYVATHKSNSVAVIDTFVDQVVAVVPVQFQPLAVAITPNGAFAYVTNSGWPVGSNSVSVIDTRTNTVVATIPVANFPVGVAITPNGAFAYVANYNSNSVSVIATATNTVTVTVGVGTGPWGLAITPMGDQHRHKRCRGHSASGEWSRGSGDYTERSFRLRDESVFGQRLGDQYRH